MGKGRTDGKNGEANKKSIQKIWCEVRIMKSKWKVLEFFLPLEIKKGLLGKATKKFEKMGFELKTTKSQKYKTVKLWGRK